MDGETTPDSNVVGELRAWRHRAVFVFSLASSLAFMPPVILMVTGQARPHGWPAVLIAVGGYFSFVVCALLYWIDYRVRAWVLLAGGYTVALIHLVTIPHGPFGRALPILLPIMAYVFFGSWTGRIITLVSIGILLVGPLLGNTPGLVEALTLEPAEEPLSANVFIEQAIALIALLVGQMILLDRFQHFLMQSLAGLQCESGKLALAYANLKRELQERRRLEFELARAADEERCRLGVDIHDGVCQQLTGALLRCEAMSRRLERGERLCFEEVAPLSTLLEEAIDESHAIAKGLCPLESFPGALAAALQTLCKRTREGTGISCQFLAEGDTNVPDPLKAQHLYRIAQEGLSNAVRHANAGRIVVRLRGEDDGLVLEVEDNGVGMTVDASAEGMGLRTMAYRANLLEGKLAVTPVSEGGTLIVCRVPGISVRSENAPRDMEKARHEN